MAAPCFDRASMRPSGGGNLDLKQTWHRMCRDEASPGAGRHRRPLPEARSRQMTQKSLERFPLHLGPGARAVPQPEFTGIDWYQAYMQRTGGDSEGWLVSMHSFDASWTSWEKHPHGEEA